MVVRLPQARALEAEPVVIVDPTTGLPATISGSAGGTANAAAPTYVEGATGQPLSLDLHGAERVLLMTPAGVAIDPTMGTAGTPAGGVSTVQGQTGMTPLDANIKNVAGSAIAQGHGTAATALRVELPTDGTGVVGLIAGSAIIGKVGIDQTTPGTTNAVALTSGAFDVSTTITRPANTTAYTANDVLGGALDLGVLGPSAGAVQINSLNLEADITSIPAGQTSWVLHLYNVTPPSALADNAAFDLGSGDRASYLGSIAFATLVDLGSTLYVDAPNLGKQVRLSGTHLFGYLVTVGGFTPAANSEVYKITLHTVAL